MKTLYNGYAIYMPKNPTPAWKFLHQQAFLHEKSSYTLKMHDLRFRQAEIGLMGGSNETLVEARVCASCQFGWHVSPSRVCDGLMGISHRNVATILWHIFLLLDVWSCWKKFTAGLSSCFCGMWSENRELWLGCPLIYLTHLGQKAPLFLWLEDV